MNYCTKDIHVQLNKQINKITTHHHSQLMQKFRKLDIFKKVPKDLSQGTNLGGLISIITVGLIVYFTSSQIYRFFNMPQVANINLDEPFTRKQLKINIDIEFPRFPCEIISLDLQDIMMSHHPNIGSIKKYRLNAEGVLLEDSDYQLLKQPDQMSHFHIVSEAFKKQYGCRLIGSFTVKEVPGNFHISAHAYQNIYNLLHSQQIIRNLNVSHKINQLSFGQITNIINVQKAHPEAQLTPLINHQQIFNAKQSFTSHYHLDIVPTIYTGALTQTQTYQYTFNHNSFVARGMPVLYFNYHIGGTRVNIYNKHSAVSKFVLNMCAVIGGIYALAHFLYNTLFVLLGTKIGYQQLAH